jgi:hypothetical protein
MEFKGEGVIEIEMVNRVEMYKAEHPLIIVTKIVIQKVIMITANYVEVKISSKIPKIEGIYLKMH